MAGTNGSNGTAVYGASGAESASYTPPALMQFSTTTDASAHYTWLFGGTFIGSVDSLWRFNNTTGQWAWMTGSPVYSSPLPVNGLSGVESASYTPGGRYGAAMWADQHGYIWLYGGFAYDTANALGYMNDLWRYNIATNKWVYINGSPGSVNVTTAGLGTLNTISQSNISGGSSYGVAWYYGTYAYVFYGYGYGTSGQGRLNTFQRTNLYTN